MRLVSQLDCPSSETGSTPVRSADGPEALMVKRLVEAQEKMLRVHPGPLRFFVMGLSFNGRTLALQARDAGSIPAYSTTRIERISAL
jgi:hypothetical protein